jgi:hypothetical protein
MWGLRDGDWKYITERLGTKSELYDLSSDAEEKNNLIESYNEKEMAYKPLLQEWYLRTNDDFTKNLNGYQSKARPVLHSEDLAAGLPKTIGFTRRDHEHSPQSKFARQDEISVVNTWHKDNSDRTILFEWEAPDKTVRLVNFDVVANWTHTRVKNPFATPLMPGMWKVRLRASNSAVLMSGLFYVE